MLSPYELKVMRLWNIHHRDIFISSDVPRFRARALWKVRLAIKALDNEEGRTVPSDLTQAPVLGVPIANSVNCEDVPEGPHFEDQITLYVRSGSSHHTDQEAVSRPNSSADASNFTAVSGQQPRTSRNTTSQPFGSGWSSYLQLM